MPVAELQANQNRKKMRELKDQGNWGSAARAANYLKKRSGVGGGHLGSLSPPPAMARRPKSPPDHKSILALIKQNKLKLDNVGGGGGGFQNLQDVRRELKLEQQRLRQEEEGNNEEDLWSQKIRTEPLDAEEAFSELKEEHAVNASVPSKLASPRLDDDPDNPLRKQKLEPPPPPSREMQHVKQMVEDGLLKMEQKMDSLERKIATVNKNASLIRGYRAEEELKKDLQNALRSEAQSSDKEQIPDNSERIKDLPSPQALVESEGPPKSFVHPPRPQLAAGSPVADAAALRDSLEFRPFRRGDEESPRLAGEATF